MITLNCKQMEPVMICHPDPEVSVAKEAAAAKAVEAAAEKEAPRKDLNRPLNPRLLDTPNRALALLTTVDRVR